MNGDSIERISQERQCQNETEGGILESASAFAQRVLEEIEALAGTTACKSVQLVRLPFQTHPGRQAFISSGSNEPRSALESRRVSLGAHWVD